MLVSKSEEVLLKAEGVKDCVKWLKNRMKETKEELDSCRDWESSGYVKERLNEQLAIKVSLEKYMKKLKHEADEII